MNKEYVIAFDQGTTSTRTIVFDLKGQVKAIAQKELTQHYPKSGWVEHNPVEIFNDQYQTFEEAIAKAKIKPEQVAGIGITNQRETTVVWDKKTGEPIHNAIVWLDKRTTSICDSLRQQGLENHIRETTGLVIDAYFSGTKLKWILDNVDGAREKADNNELLFGTIDSWLIYKFTNGKQHVTDYTNASRTLMYNMKSQEWDDTMLNALGVPKSMLPKVQASSSDFGSVNYKDVDIPIYGVAGDQQAALFGQGAFESGMAKNTYGTGCFMLMHTGTKHVASQNGLLTTLACNLETEPVNFALEGSVFVGGASIQWLRDKMKLIKNAAETEAICESIPPLEEVYVVPAFAGLGAPYWDENAKGSIYGMTLDTGKEHLVKATVEALAYQTRDVIDAMVSDSGTEIVTLKVDGGASANNYLMQFQADILNTDVERPEMLEVTAFGAALLAGIKAGVWIKANAESIRKIDRTFLPEMLPKVRKKKYKGWKKAVERTKSKSKNKTETTAMRFSILNRKKQLKRLKNTTYDLVIIGGGITGAGIALDASSRGLNVCLIEKNDFASGTSNKSTKLIHGGLRYLKQFEIGLVKESGTERAVVHRLAPHLVIPEKMILPLIEGGTYGRLMTSFGLKVYDFLADVEGDDRREMLEKKETLGKEPLLNPDNVLGSGYYAEYRTDDARLTIEILKKASEFGATICNYCEMESFEYEEGGNIKALNCIDHNLGSPVQIKAKKYVSAAGPWVDTLRKKDNSINHKYLHLTKGVHIVFPFEKLPVKQSIYFDVPDGRMIFAIPRGRVTYVGTTDTNYSGSLDRVVATKADAEYLLNAVNNMFPSITLKIEDIESNWAGLRPLIHEAEKDPSELSRKDEIFISDSGLVSIAGGKLTGYRKMAQRVVETVLKTMTTKEKAHLKRSYTRNIPLVTPAMHSSSDVKRYENELQTNLKEFGLNDSYYAWHLSSTYGKKANVILEKALSLDADTPEEAVIRAELWYGIHFEMVNSLADFFVRRTGALYFNIQNVTRYRDAILNDCIQYLDWNKKRIHVENERLNQLLQDATKFYDNEF